MVQQESIDIQSAKRSKKERSGVHNWHPYYAGYSEKFVESAIQYLGLTDRKTILDPWNGSGTTTLVSQRMGLNSNGLDINPAMVIFANAKRYENLLASKDLLKTSKEVALRAKRIRTECIPTEEFVELTSTSYAKSVFAVQASIEQQLQNNNHFIAGDKQNPFECFLYAALFIANRNSGFFKKGSNPTWTKTESVSGRHNSNTFFDSFIDQVEQMNSDLEITFANSNVSSPKAEATIGDVRNLPFNNNSFDAIITSPPYLTRIDYAVSTKPELLILGDSQFLRTIREATMGAPVIVDKSIAITKDWGKTLPILLKQIENHPTKAAKSYYLPNIKQYFRDTVLSLKEIKRVLKKEARALLVVQSSYFKEIELNLGDLYCEISESIGLDAKIARREVVKGHMAHVNTRSNKYADQKVFFEDVVEVTK